MPDEQLKDIIRTLRKNQTKSERQMWKVLRSRKLNGYKFLRQHPIHCSTFDGERVFIADFYCSERKLVIEIDGAVHNHQRDYDETRTIVIEQKGLKVLRFTNEEIESNLGDIIDQLSSLLENHTHPA